LVGSLVLPFCYVQVWYSAVADNSGRSGALSNEVISGGGPGASLDISALHILGLPTGMTEGLNPTVSVNGGGPAGAGITYDSSKGVMRIEGLTGVKLSQALKVNWQV
jgi:hypothetical protein